MEIGVRVVDFSGFDLLSRPLSITIPQPHKIIIRAQFAPGRKTDSTFYPQVPQGPGGVVSGESGRLPGYRVRLSCKDWNRRSKFKLCLKAPGCPGTMGPGAAPLQGLSIRRAPPSSFLPLPSPSLLPPASPLPAPGVETRLLWALRAGFLPRKLCLTAAEAGSAPGISLRWRNTHCRAAGTHLELASAQSREDTPLDTQMSTEMQTGWETPGAWEPVLGPGLSRLAPPAGAEA